VIISFEIAGEKYDPKIWRERNWAMQRDKVEALFIESCRQVERAAEPGLQKSTSPIQSRVIS
jgi:uncharacterized protein (DUF2132 family)